MWDALDAIINYIDPGFVAHGIACFCIFFMTFVSVFLFFFVVSPPYPSHFSEILIHFAL